MRVLLAVDGSPHSQLAVTRLLSARGRTGQHGAEHAAA
jgi:hypothetical protein